MKKEDAGSCIAFIAAMLIYGTIGLFRRWIPLSSGLIAATRGVTGALCLALYVKCRGRKLFTPLSRRDLLMLILSGVLIGANWVLMFEAYNYTTVATATLCYYMQPTIVILLSPFVLNEKLTLRRALCAAAGIVGMVFVSGVLSSGGVGSSDLTGILLGLGAAALYSCVVLINKKIYIENASEKTVIQIFSAGVSMTLWQLCTVGISFAGLTSNGLLMLVIVCVIHTGLAYALYFGGMQGISAQSSAILSYIDPVAALILSALVLGESMTVFGIIGAVLIILSAIISERK